MNDQDYLNKLFDEVHYMVVGVILEDGTPWAVPVHITHHEGNAFEWLSRPESVHSKALLSNPSISLTVFSADLDLGFYAKATAQEVPNTIDDDGRVRYRATVHESWLNESHNKRRLL